MSQNKTIKNDSSVINFINNLKDDEKIKDANEICNIMKLSTGYDAQMWGTAIIGFGSYHYKYASGREGDAPLAGFSPRKNAFALYFTAEFDDRENLLTKLGKHKIGVACVYVKKLVDIDQNILKQMIKKSVENLQMLYPS